MAASAIAAGAPLLLDTLGHETQSPPRPRAGDPPAEIRRAAQAFEAFFIGQMMDYMFAGVSTEPPFGGGPAEGVFRSLLLQEYGKGMAARGGLGIADAVTRALLEHQESP